MAGLTRAPGDRRQPANEGYRTTRAQMTIARKGLIAAAIVIVAGASALAFNRLRPDLALRVATAVVAHNVCDKVFVSNLDPQTSFDEVTARETIDAA